MPDECVLETLKSAVDIAFEAKQKAYKKFDKVRSQTNSAYEVMQKDWDVLSKAKTKMEEEYNVIYDEPNSKVWEEFAEFKNETHSQIELLRREAESEKHKADRCFNQARSAYEYGDKSEAPVFAQKGHEHRERLSQLNSEIGEKCQAIRDARQKAERIAPRKNNADFEAARFAYEEAKERHRKSRRLFLHSKKELDNLRKEFENAKTLFYCARKRYFDRLNPSDPVTNEETIDQVFTEEPNPLEMENKKGFFQRLFVSMFS
ncbi:MAG: putative nuclear RNA export factor SDE5 [Bacillus sp. (in: Bacteria)]|nr:putative nuclear RNA export factor SDE5 [Candidatus Saccharibacteria bacterium]MBR3122501.1 putative nuclear RNA export factor SDE5 [Candidatus Saccharibacteria bacterium]MBR3335668.1 putative nuclear RNA export factor SDE5 [Bacillus sp. (in: firmicutes)]